MRTLDRDSAKAGEEFLFLNISEAAAVTSGNEGVERQKDFIKTINLTFLLSCKNPRSPHDINIRDLKQ
jgi:hypothetical protein